MEECPKTVSNVMRRSSQVLWCPAGLTFSSVNIKPTLSSQSFRGQGDLLYRAVTRLKTHRGKLETARRDLNGLMSSFDWFINKLTIVNDKPISLWLPLIILLCKQTGSVTWYRRSLHWRLMIYLSGPTLEKSAPPSGMGAPPKCAIFPCVAAAVGQFASLRTNTKRPCHFLESRKHCGCSRQISWFCVCVSASETTVQS